MGGLDRFRTSPPRLTTLVMAEEDMEHGGALLLEPLARRAQQEEDTGDAAEGEIRLGRETLGLGSNIQAQ